MIDIKKMLTKILTNLNTLNNRITYTTIFSAYDYKGTKSNEWEYIGKTFTVPSGHAYLVRFDQTYASGKPIGLGIHNANNLSGATAIPRYGSVESSDGVQCSPLFYLTAGDYYMYTKRATVPTSANRYYCYAIDMIR